MSRAGLVSCFVLIAACGGSHPTEEEAYASTVASACQGVDITEATAEAHWQRGGDDPVGCAASAHTCDAFEACAEPPDDPCTGPDACDGNIRVRCLGGVEVREWCGAACVQTADGPACVDREEPCEATRCLDENTLLVCVDGAGVRQRDCRDRFGGGLCAVQDGQAACAPTAAQCPDGRAECVEDVGRVCYEGVWIEFPCGDVEGFTCQVPEAGTLRCIPEP